MKLLRSLASRAARPGVVRFGCFAAFGFIYGGVMIWVAALFGLPTDNWRLWVFTAAAVGINIVIDFVAKEFVRWVAKWGAR
jgi:hypothetical protein